MAELERLTDEPAILGEGPCWHAQKKVLYWIDILGKRLHCYDPADSSDRFWDIGQLVGTVAPRASGGLLLGLVEGFAYFDPDTEELEHLPAIEPGTMTRFNDGKCDPAGRFWCGSMDLKEEEALGSLYRMGTDGDVAKIESNVSISNGLGWSPDRSTMYYIDSPTKTVSAFDYNLETGAATNRRSVFRLGEDEGYPDGMTVDNEGMIWLAHWAGARVCRWNPNTCELLERYDTPAPHTSACCFGGDDLSDLYITTARKGLSDEQLEKYPLSGHLFRLRTDVTGSETFSFAG